MWCTEYHFRLTPHSTLVYIRTTFFDVQKVCILVSRCVLMCCMIVSTNSSYLPKENNILVFVIYTQCVS
jgi:hypothetical protein